MYQSKFVVSLVLGVVAIGALSGPAYGKRRRSTKAADDTPATEVDSDSTTHAAAAAPPTELASAPAVEKTIAIPPPVEPAPPRLPAARHDAPDADISRQTPPRAEDPAASRLSGHVGVGSPLVTLRASRSSRHVSSVNDELTLVAPIGLGIPLADHWTFDFEFQISTGVRPEGLTTAIVDPGVLHSWDRITAGLRVAWQLNANQNIGLIPLVRVALVGNARANWFVEGALPASVRDKQVTASASLQTGVAF